MELPITPFQQGDLDGLCGVYAVLNAARILCPEIDDDYCDELFAVVLEKLAKSLKKPMRAVVNGTSRPHIALMVKAAAAEIERDLEIKLKATGLKTPKKKVALPQLWEALQEEIGSGAVVILALSGRRDHWTVAYHMSDRTIRLADSNSLKVILRSHCTLRPTRQRTRILPGETLLLTREGQT
jgi:hypothetical protein